MSDDKATFTPYYDEKDNFGIRVHIRGCDSIVYNFFKFSDDKNDNFVISMICKEHFLDSEEEKRLRETISKTKKERLERDEVFVDLIRGGK